MNANANKAPFKRGGGAASPSLSLSLSPSRGGESLAPGRRSLLSLCCRDMKREESGRTQRGNDSTPLSLSLLVALLKRGKERERKEGERESLRSLPESEPEHFAAITGRLGIQILAPGGPLAGNLPSFFLPSRWRSVPQRSAPLKACK